jgi:translation initiation factor 1
MTKSLCETCINRRDVQTSRSRFLLCELSVTNADFPKYPSQPVIRCDGYREVEKKAGPIVRLGWETKGRRGKGVTIVSDIPLGEAGLLELAATLKDRCGTGGTVKDRRIEIQGDQRDRLTTLLEGMGYRVKRVGG